jgi:hypothetical protein
VGPLSLVVLLVSTALNIVSDPNHLAQINAENQAKIAGKPQSGQVAGAQTGGAQPVAATPAKLLNLANWKLTLPIGSDGKPTEIMQPQLGAYTNPAFFFMNGAHSGVVFRANAGGVTTSGSSYPRSELREMSGGGKANASWSNTSGVHTMEVREAITHLPAAKPDVVAAQIHDASDDVVEVRLEGSVLSAQYNDGKNSIVLDGGYQLGSAYNLKIVAANGLISVFYNGAHKGDIPKSGSGWYFKAGCYTQSNTSKGDAPTAYGEVAIYSLGVSHT